MDWCPGNDHLGSSGLDLDQTEEPKGFRVIVQEENVQRCTANELLQHKSFGSHGMGGGARDHVMTCNVTRVRVVCLCLDTPLSPVFVQLKIQAYKRVQRDKELRESKKRRHMCYVQKEKTEQDSHHDARAS